jgi:hypothetical protein
MAKRKTRISRRATTRRTTAPRRSKARGGRPWSRQEIAFLRKNYRQNETSWVARQLGRTVYSVRYKASDLNIRKAKPSVWKGNKGNAQKPTRRTTRTRKTASRRRMPKTRWARTTRRTTRKASSRRNSRSKRR